MTDTTSPPPPRQGLPELEQTVLRYYVREALKIDNTAAPLGGLTVARFKIARGRLVQSGLLRRDRRGRYRPSAMQEDD